MHNIDPELDASIHQHLAEEDKAENEHRQTANCSPKWKTTLWKTG